MNEKGATVQVAKNVSAGKAPAFKISGTGSIPEEDARRAVLPVGEARERLGSNHQDVAIQAGFDQLRR